MAGRKASLAGGIAVVLLTLALVGGIRWAGPPIYDGDGWYHVKYAEIIKEQGISRAFPWFQESFLREHFTDFNLLYHLLLIPFTLGDPLHGARVVSVLCAAATMGMFWGTARALRVPWPALWAVGLIALAPELTYRLTYTRPFVLAIGLAVAGTGAILLRRPWLAFSIAFAYAHLHCSFHLLPCIAMFHDFVRERVRGENLEARVAMTLWTGGGVLAASVLTPYFPNNFHMWWVTNIDVLRASWAMGDALRVGTEMLPLPPLELLAADAWVFVVLVVGLALVAWRRSLSDETRVLLPIAMGFCALTFMSQRFVEMWAPFTCLFTAVATRDVLAEHAPARPWLRRTFVAAVAAVIAFGGWRTWDENRAAAAGEDPPAYLEAGAWMKENIPAGETIFNLGWDEFPELFYADATHNYVVGQDATFMWVTDPGRTRLWVDVARGRVRDPYATIRDTFGCRTVFVPARYVTFTKIARSDPRFREVWSNLMTSVWRLDGPAND